MSHFFNSGICSVIGLDPCQSAKSTATLSERALKNTGKFQDWHQESCLEHRTNNSTSRGLAMNIEINKYFMVIVSNLLVATVNITIAAENLTLDQMDGVTAGAVSVSVDANSNFGAFSSSKGSSASTSAEVGDTFTRARGTSTSGQIGGTSSKVKTIGMPGARSVPPGITTVIPEHGNSSSPANRLTPKRLKLQPFKPLL